MIGTFGFGADASRRLSKLTLTLAFVVVGTKANAWGPDGHQIVAEVAAEISGDAFWEANNINLGVVSNVPDWSWKSLATATDEKPTHYFEPDGFFPNLSAADMSDFSMFPRKWADAVRTYGEPMLIKHGTAVWRIEQFHKLAVDALVAKDAKLAVEMAGAMTHYAGDLSQPLHVTINYDGQLTRQKGIHKFFESTNIQTRDYDQVKQDVMLEAESLLSDKNYISSAKGSLDDMIFKSVERSYLELQTILDIDKTMGRKKGAEDMYAIAVSRMADGAATLALLLNDISKKGGKPLMVQTVKIDTPAWVAPQYDSQKRRKWRTKAPSFFNAPKIATNSELTIGCE